MVESTASVTFRRHIPLALGNGQVDVITIANMESMMLIGGETTPVLPERHGKGGRNQQYAARKLFLLKDYPADWVVA